jgi:hypothetical protein
VFQLEQQHDSEDRDLRKRYQRKDREHRDLRDSAHRDRRIHLLADPIATIPHIPSQHDTSEQQGGRDQQFHSLPDPFGQGVAQKRWPGADHAHCIDRRLTGPGGVRWVC